MFGNLLNKLYLLRESDLREDSFEIFGGIFEEMFIRFRLSFFRFVKFWERLLRNDFWVDNELEERLRDINLVRWRSFVGIVLDDKVFERLSNVNFLSVLSWLGILEEMRLL